ncbi:MAG: hypothetical protein JW717_11970 [Marinilabiliaceae bacterium]|nr:hypothetical protein [Marinilabiliaceae bacterium]
MIYIALLIIIGIIAGIIANKLSSKKEEPEAKTNNRPIDCCGGHDVCESETLLSSSEKIIYFEDEELDAFKGISPHDYNDNNIEEFREVLTTLKEFEVAGWLRSLQLRGIVPPYIVKEEALMIVAERREKGKNDLI